MATWYLSPDGNDTTGNGSYAAPYKTISKTHTIASSGDTVILKTSTSTYTLASQSFTKSLTIQGETTTPENHILDGASSKAMWDMSTTASMTLTVKYLQFQNAYAEGNGFMTFYASDCEFVMDACKILNYRLSGAISASGDYALFYSRAGSAEATRGDCCIYNTLIDAYGTAGRYTCIFGTSGSSSRYTMDGCTVFSSPTKETVTNFCQAYAGQTLTATIKNTIAFFGTLSVFFGGSGTNATIATYCDFYNLTSSPSGTGNITSDPLFVDAANGNFNLRPSSPCINTGTLV
jgi:hypothetical protein